MNGVVIRNFTTLEGKILSVQVEGGYVKSLSEGELPAPPDTTVFEANGGTLLPGLVDTHCHPFEYGWLLRNVDLKGTANLTALRARVTARVRRAGPGEWVAGMGWDQENFPEGRMPNRSDVDDISPSNPLMLTRVCGHIALLNTKAIEVLGLGNRSGPEYERDGAGQLTGIIKESALSEAQSNLPRSSETCVQDLLAAEMQAARLGLTALHTIVSSEGFAEELTAMAALAKEGSLQLHHRVFIPPNSVDFIRDSGIGVSLQGGPARVNGVKLYADGSLGARTAALREPYSDDPATSGILRLSDEEMSEIVEGLDSRGFQVIIHAIGDRAVEQAVEALGRVSSGGNPRGHRIEHASVLPKDLRSKMARHSIRATVQPLFVASDTWAEKRLGEERMKDLYPFKSILAEGLTVSAGSDAPIESFSPILGMWSAMSRDGIQSGEALALEQAISLYTSAARLNGMDRAAGLTEGAPADFTLLDSDIHGTHPALLRRAEVALTLVGGTIGYSRLTSES